MKKGKRAIAILLAVVIIFVIWGVQYGARLLLASQLKLDKIEVQGCQRTDPRQVVEAASVAAQTPILELSLKEISQRVAYLPWVRSCIVRRVLPDTLSLKVIERHPIALIRLDRLYYVDEDGTTFKEPGPGEPLDLPVVTGWDDDAWKRGERRDLIESALWILKVVQGHPTLAKIGISEIRCSENGDITIYTLDGTMILLGAENIELKLRRLEEVYKGLVARRLPVRYILYEIPDRIVVGLEKRG